MTRNRKLMWSPITAALLAAPSLLAATGCGSEPAAPAAATASTDFSADELAAMRKSVRSQGEYRQLLRIKTLERAGVAKVKYPPEKGKAANRR